MIYGALQFLFLIEILLQEILYFKKTILIITQDKIFLFLDIKGSYFNYSLLFS